MAGTTYQVVITQRAEESLERILDYLAIVVEVDRAKRNPEKLKEQFGK